MSLKDSMRSDAKLVFANFADFAEKVEYLPRNGGSRTINAIVDREPPAVYDPTGNVVMISAIIEVANDCKFGISSAELDTGGDRVALTIKHNETIPKRFSVMQMLHQDEGMIRVALK